MDIEYSNRRYFCSFHNTEIDEKKYLEECSQKNDGEGCEYAFDLENLQDSIKNKREAIKEKLKRWKARKKPPKKGISLVWRKQTHTSMRDGDNHHKN